MHAHRVSRPTRLTSATATLLTILFATRTLADPTLPARTQAECDCQFFGQPNYAGTPINLCVDDDPVVVPPSPSSDPCISFHVLSQDAAIKISILDEVYGETGPYGGRPTGDVPRVFLYSRESNFGAFGTDQYCGRTLKVECISRTKPLPQPDVFLPFDASNVNPCLYPACNDANLRLLSDVPAGHKVLVLRRAFFWENSEDLGGFHGPYGDMKIEVYDRRIVDDYDFEDVARNLQIKLDHRIPGLAVSELPGPMWSGYADHLHPDPFDEWIDGPWGCVYSNIVVYDWGEDPEPTDAIAVGAGEAGPSDDYLGAQVVTVAESEAADVTIPCWSFGWITVRTITAAGRERSVDAAHVYWYPGWDGVYPEEVYGPKTIACKAYAICPVGCHEVFPRCEPLCADCQRVRGSQFWPLTDTDLFSFLREQTPSPVRVGVLHGAAPGIMSLDGPVVFAVNGVPAVMEQGQGVPELSMTLFNYSSTRRSGEFQVTLVLSPDPIGPDAVDTSNDRVIGSLRVAASLDPLALSQPLLASGRAQVPCDLSPGIYFLGTRVDDGDVSCPGSVVRIDVVTDRTAPIISCLPSITVECSQHGGTSRKDAQLVPLFGRVSVTDACGAGVVDDAPTVFPVGETQVDFAATDPSGNRATCVSTVRVVDRTPPVLTVALSKSSIWPPNHRMVDIMAHVVAADVCDDAPLVTLLDITSNEPVDGLGDGDTAPDILGAVLGTRDTVFQVRAERRGPAQGRVYTVRYQAIDESQNVATAEAVVRVSHDRGAPKVQATRQPETGTPRVTGIVGMSPNPARSDISLTCDVARETRLSARIVAVDGRVVRTLCDEVVVAGSRSFRWDLSDQGGRRVAPGVYYVQLVAGEVRNERAIVVLGR